MTVALCSVESAAVCPGRRAIMLPAAHSCSFEVRLAGPHRSIRNRLGPNCLALCWSRRQVWRASRFSARMASNLARSDTWPSVSEESSRCSFARWVAISSSAKVTPVVVRVILRLRPSLEETSRVTSLLSSRRSEGLSPCRNSRLHWSVLWVPALAGDGGMGRAAGGAVTAARAAPSPSCRPPGSPRCAVSSPSWPFPLGPLLSRCLASHGRKMS